MPDGDGDGDGDGDTTPFELPVICEAMPARFGARQRLIADSGLTLASA
jgi:hypothetical protein